MSPQVWFITGASSGVGRAATEYILARGDIVVATLRKPEVLDELKTKYAADRLLVLKLDVTKPKEIEEAFQKAIEVFKRIDVVFNNAAFGLFSEIEASTDEAVRSLFDTNFFGAMNVTREAVKVFREVNKPIGGRILVTSALAGCSPVPFAGYYTGTKFALEGTTATFVGELDPDWNIKVTLVKLGAFSTSMFSNAIIPPPHPAYTKPTLPTVIGRGLFANPNGLTIPWNDLEKTVARIYQLATLDNPPLHVALGKDALGAIRNQIELLRKELEQYESWSADLSPGSPGNLSLYEQWDSQ